ncbi:MAG: metalloprotease TldD [Proteobacteria bacterium]|nr:metalloprotease TldD [Pseudomonadota bacterium]
MKNDPHALFLTHLNLSATQLGGLVSDALHGADDGELFLESRQSELLVLEDGRVKTSTYANDQGFGLRRVVGEFAGLVHGNQMTPFALKAAAKDLRAVAEADRKHFYTPDLPAIKGLYPAHNPLGDHALGDKIALLSQIDAYVRKQSPDVKQVIVSLRGEHQNVMIIRADGQLLTDVRPLVRMDVQVILEKNGKRESGHNGFGSRVDYKDMFTPTRWQAAADEALRMAGVMLDAKPAPAGEMPVIMSAGWSGVLLHEAVGHGLEGDFNRKGTSAFAGLLGQQVAAKGVTVVDDGSLANRRGSVTIDDEGTPGQYTVLIEDGILRGYMQDRLNARLMGMAPTGNGRRESYAHEPLPRMTNTYMLGGNDTPEDIIKDTKYGLYAKTFGGGQVDITSGSYVFNVSEAYLVEDGKITAPVKGASLIGNGPESLKYVDRIGNDMSLDPGIGTCGKSGQGVPVGVGQPTLRLSAGVTVGGTGQ